MAKLFVIVVLLLITWLNGYSQSPEIFVRRDGDGVGSGQGKGPVFLRRIKSGFTNFSSSVTGRLSRASSNIVLKFERKNNVTSFTRRQILFA